MGGIVDALFGKRPDTGAMERAAEEQRKLLDQQRIAMEKTAAENEAFMKQQMEEQKQQQAYLMEEAKLKAEKDKKLTFEAQEKSEKEKRRALIGGKKSTMLTGIDSDTEGRKTLLGS